MENTIYNIILANGTEIHATLNGNNYITDDEVNIEIHIGELLQSFDLAQTHQIMSPNARAVEIANRLASIFKLGKNAE